MHRGGTTQKEFTFVCSAVFDCRKHILSGGARRCFQNNGSVEIRLGFVRVFIFHIYIRYVQKRKKKLVSSADGRGVASLDAVKKAATGCGGGGGGCDSFWPIFASAALRAEVTNTFQCQVQPVKSLVINMRIN